MDPGSCHSSILDLWPPDLGKYQHLLLKPPTMWECVSGAPMTQVMSFKLKNKNPQENIFTKEGDWLPSRDKENGRLQEHEENLEPWA